LKRPLLISGVAAALALLLVILCITGQIHFPQSAQAQAKVAAIPKTQLKQKNRDRLNMEARGLYLTSWVAGTKRFHEIADGVSRSGLNALVIDIKDCTGKVGYDSLVPMVAEIKARERRIRDLDGVLAYCRERGIHTIARIAVFQDPVLADAKRELAVKTSSGSVWTDNKGQSWVDPASRCVWKYNVDLAKEAAARGFNEVQFDYVRFPTDGRLTGLVYPAYKGDVPKRQVIKEFFQYVDQELKSIDILVSADIFGLTTVAEDDLNIGQKIEDIAPYVDYVCPMVYPSHFPPGYLGLKNPAEEPYKVIFDSCSRGLERVKGQRAKLRPWIQDFDIGARYDRHMILEQIRALRDAGAFGFCSWNARNVYTISDYAAPLPQANPSPPPRSTLTASVGSGPQ